MEFFFTKNPSTPFRVDDFFLFLLILTRNNLEQNFGISFFNFIIFLSIIIFENMTFLEKYLKNWGSESNKKINFEYFPIFQTRIEFF